MLTGVVAGEPVTLAMLDHPKNVGFPTYWHARGYGLFAANPLGLKVFTNGKEQLNFPLGPGESTTFRHRVLILSGRASPAHIETSHRDSARRGAPDTVGRSAPSCSSSPPSTTSTGRSWASSRPPCSASCTGPRRVTATSSPGSPPCTRWGSS